MKRGAIERARAFGEDNVAKIFDAASLSRRTVTHRISDIHDHIEGKLKHVMQVGCSEVQM